MPDNAIELLIALFLVHFLADFPLQRFHWIEERYRKHAASSGLYLHAGTHGLGSFLCFWLLTPSLLLALAASAVVMVTHFLTDLAKSYTRRGSLPAFVVDQLVHWAVLLGVWSAYAGTDVLFSLLAVGVDARVLLLLLAYLLVTLPFSVLVGLCLRPWIDEVKSLESEEDSLTKAGATIGYLERVLILTFVLLGEYIAIGFVLALKTAFRFKDTDERRKAEYIMMGTFLSFALTIALGMGVSYLLPRLV